MKRLWHAGFDGTRRVTAWDLRKDKVHGAMRRRLLAIDRSKRSKHPMTIRSRWSEKKPEGVKP